MAMSYVWVILLFVSVVFGVLSGSAGAVGAAAVQARSAPWSSRSRSPGR